MADRPPNVLVLLSDEQSWNTLGSAGNPAARTPHLDALAEHATSFDGCHTPFPLCCPSRASLWTARMPRNHHILGNWRAIAPHLRDHSVARAFRDAGYHTLYTGKWHVPGTDPRRMGFSDTTAIPAVLGGKDRGRYIEPYRRYAAEQGYRLDPDHIENLTERDLALISGSQAPMCGTSEISLDDYLETWQTGQFLEALDRRPDDRAFFAVCSYNAPHFPMVVPSPYDTAVDRSQVRLPASFATGPGTKPREVRESHFASRFAHLGEDQWTELVAHYYGFCALIDTQVGRILDRLRSIGELDRTIVVFTSDHGDMMGAHRLMEKGHLLPYEEATHIPLLVSHPDGGTVRTDGLVSVVDIAPTLAELAGVEWDHGGDGRSFAGMLSGASTPVRDYVTTESCLYGMSADANGDYVSPRDWNADRDALNLSVRTLTARYIYRSRDEDELYDHTVDPGEQRNVARDADYAAERQRLRSLLAAEVADVFPDAVPPLAESVPRTG